MLQVNSRGNGRKEGVRGVRDSVLGALRNKSMSQIFAALAPSVYLYDVIYFRSFLNNKMNDPSRLKELI